MDVPFISSGASSRAHYALVRKVESAPSGQAANQSLLAEVKSIREHFATSTVPLIQCKEYLIILLYCFMTATPGFLPNDTFTFALPHAISLAEAGRKVNDKRIGYLFCAEVMPSGHEMQLMLVNTLRKDIESSSIPRICLALDNVIISSNDDLIPAIQPRLHDLLSHNSPHVRRRALLTYRALSQRNPEILARIGRNIIKRLEDPHQTVVSAAMAVSGCIPRNHESAHNVKHTVNKLLKEKVSNARGPKHWLLLRILHTTLSLGISEENIPLIFELIRLCSGDYDYAVLRGAFLLFPNIDTETLLLLSHEHGSPVQYIRSLLTSHEANEQFIFLSCLECVDPVAWAGISPNVPAILEEWEVEQVMQLLDSSDNFMRRKTLRILNKVDPNIVTSFYSQTLQTIPLELSLKDKNEYSLRLLEVLETQLGEDGELYAQEVKKLLGQLENASTPKDHPVLETAVEIILLYIRESKTSFRVGCAAVLLTFAVEPNLILGQTLTVVISALICEFSSQLAISPLELLQGLASRLSFYTPSVQDACLLAMLRITADCNEVPTEIINKVTNLGQLSGRHIKQRCEQFVDLADKRSILIGIVQRARSSSLPDFLESLQNYTARPSQLATLPPSSVVSSSKNLSGGSKLRYKAYEAPPPAQRLRPRRASSSQHSVGSSRSETFSDHGHESLNRASSRLSASSSDPLSRTITAGELALEAGGRDLELLSKSPPKTAKSLSPKRPVAEDLSSRMDLIAFDSPFVSNPSTASTNAGNDPNFEGLWDSFGDANASRGWCNTPIDTVIQRLQGLPGQRLEVISADILPFLGDLKVLMSPEPTVPTLNPPGNAVLRLRESEDESCLWRLRCGDTMLRTQIRNILADE